MSEYPKYEKVNENIIRIIIEKADDVPVTKLLENKKMLEEKKAQIEQTLKAINDVLEQANKLGIVPEEKDKNPEKNK